MKLSFHQHIALFWMIGAPGVFAPVIENAKRPDAGAVMAWGVAIVAVMILFTPLLLRCPPFRRWYGRTDALSERQRQALHGMLAPVRLDWNKAAYERAWPAEDNGAQRLPVGVQF